MVKKVDLVHVWLNFDFGFRGDFEGLFYLLDKYKAIECGSDLAYFVKPPKKDFIKSLKKEITDNVKLQRTDRIYVIIRYKEKLSKGFLFGRHKRAAWEGYASEPTQEIDDIL